VRAQWVVVAVHATNVGAARRLGPEIWLVTGNVLRTGVTVRAAGAINAHTALA
jgi:hypothetical protein